MESLTLHLNLIIDQRITTYRWMLYGYHTGDDGTCTDLVTDCSTVRRRSDPLWHRNGCLHAGNALFGY